MNDTTEAKHPWLQLIARTGYVTKGFVYFMVGLLALQTAIGMKEGASSTQQTLREFLNEPYGSILLIGCSAGLLAHAIWRILQAVIDPENRGKSLQTILFRFIDFLTGCLYLSLAYAAWQIFNGLHAQSSNKSTEIWVGKVLQLPYGKWIVLLSALIIVIAGLYQFYTAYSGSFTYSFEKERMSIREENFLGYLGRIGMFSWGIVYLMIAVLFYKAAIQYNANKAGGLSEALNALRSQPFGNWILGITSGGLLIYGIYLFVLSYYHQVYGK